MSQTQKTDQAVLQQRLAEYRELQEQFMAMRSRLQRAEEQRHTVNRRVYDRVRAEYDREMDALRAKMSPLRSQLDEVRIEYEEALEQVNAELESIEEELAELTFRHRIGEYTDEVMDARKGEIDARIAQLRARIDEIRETLTVLEGDDAAMNSHPDELADNPAAVHGGLAESGSPGNPAAASNRRPVLRARAGDAGARPSFENPHDWIDEIRTDGRAAADAAAPAAGTEAASPSNAVAENDSGPAQPSLVFVSGPHAGQSIPLLRTTLTIGREHDNNIEIKDSDVARYHARILNERGEYVVEDMGSTTGTWVNGERVPRAPLGHGDVIKIGQTEIAIDFEWTLDSLQRSGVDPSA